MFRFVAITLASEQVRGPALRQRTVAGFVLSLIVATTNAAFATPQSVTLLTHRQRSEINGQLQVQTWRDCGPDPYFPCVDYNNPFVVANSVTASTAAWTWDSATGVLASSGLFWTTWHLAISTKPVMRSDRVVDLVIDTFNDTTTASEYRCIDGDYLNLSNNNIPHRTDNRCGGYNNGENYADESTVNYNVDGDPYCVRRTLGGDDFSTGNPRGLIGFLGSSSCDPTDGAFDLWTIVENNLNTGGTLTISNGICIGNQTQTLQECSNANWMTFGLAPVPIPPAVWLFGSALGVMGWMRRKATS